MLLYLMRHGQTDWNIAYKLQGSSDIPLNANGIAMAKAAAKGMSDIPFTRIYSSPLIRAKKTAQLVAEPHHLPVIVDDRLREMCFGIMEGKSGGNEPVIRAYFRDPAHYAPPERAESYEELDIRCRSFLNDLFADCGTDETVLIVAHGALDRGLMRVLQNTPLEDFWADPVLGNCCAHIYSCENGKAVLVASSQKFF